MAISAILRLSCSVLVCAMLVSSQAPCLFDFGILSSCFNYLTTGDSDDLTPSCCSGVETVRNIANLGDGFLRDICTCVEGLLSTLFLDRNIAARLPRDCNVTVPYPINVHVDCSKLKVIS
ncbi:Non-specific lipid-transfer protein 5-like protein [Drosera capensis]